VSRRSWLIRMLKIQIVIPTRGSVARGIRC
jgi:hypothetical protein